MINEPGNFSAADLAKKYDTGVSTVYKVLSKKQKIKETFLRTQNADSKIEQRECKFESVNGIVYDWFCRANAQGLPISGTLLQAKAKEIAESLNVNEFKASNGWLSSFKRRHDLTFGAISGEAGDVNSDVVADWMRKLPEIIRGYELKDIANCDETALFFRALPQKTLHFKGEKCSGGKFCKERLTVFLCCFADGAFEKPMIIGRANKPRCFKGVDKANLPVTWKFNKKAWMTGSIMEEWLIEFNAKMFRQKRKVLLFLDNASSHPLLKLSNVEMVFLPPKTTCALQPLDQGIIQSFKVAYRTRVLKHLIAKIESEKASKLASSITVLDAVLWSADAVKTVTTRCVANCFRKAGISFDHTETTNSETVIDSNPLVQLIGQINSIQMGDDLMSATEFLAIDNETYTENDDISSNIDSQEFDDADENDENDENDEANDNNNNSQEQPKMTHTVALNLAECLKRYALEQSSATLISHVNTLTQCIQDEIIKKKSKQTTLDNFFSVRNQ